MYHRSLSVLETRIQVILHKEVKFRQTDVSLKPVLKIVQVKTGMVPKLVSVLLLDLGVAVYPVTHKTTHSNVESPFTVIAVKRELRYHRNFQVTNSELAFS